MAPSLSGLLYNSPLVGISMREGAQKKNLKCDLDLEKWAPFQMDG